MANTFDQSYVTIFSKELKHAFQQEIELLRPLIRVERSSGNTHRFPKLGAMTAVTNKTRHAEFTATDTVHSYADATMTKVNVVDYLDDLDQFQTNINFREAYVRSAVMSAHKEMDDLVIAALNTASSSIDELDVSDTMNKAGLIKFGKALNLNDVPNDGNRSLFLSNGGEEDLLSDTTLTSIDYVREQMLQAGVAKNVMGFNVRRSNYLTAGTTGHTKNFGFHKDAVGLAIAKDIDVRIDYVADKGSWIVNASFVAGSVVIDNNGVVWSEIDD